MDDELRRYLLERLKVMKKRLLDQMPFLDPGPAHMPLHKLPGGLGNDSGNLCFPDHMVTTENLPFCRMAVKRVERLLLILTHLDFRWVRKA